MERFTKNTFKDSKNEYRADNRSDLSRRFIKDTIKKKTYLQKDSSYSESFQNEMKEFISSDHENPKNKSNFKEGFDDLIQSTNSKYIINTKRTHKPEKQNNRFLSPNFLITNTNLQTEQVIKKYLEIPELTKAINNTNYLETLLYNQITNLLIISRSSSESAKLILKTFLNSFFFNILRDFLLKKNNDIELFKILKCEKKNIFFNFLTETSEFLLNISNYFLSFQSKFPTYELEDLILKLKQTYEKNDPEFIYVQFFSQGFEKYKSNLNPSSKTSTTINLKEALKKGFIEITNVPIDYQSSPIDLTAEELFEKDSKKQIEVHREKGSYESWERYLNTLFYLTREDCFRSLRKEIEIIFNKQPNEANSKINKLSDVYYYKKISIDSLEAGKFGVSLKIEIDLRENKIRILGNKRLLHGSLVILTDEGLETTVFCLVKEIDKNYIKKHKTKTLVSLEFLNLTFEEINKITALKSKGKAIQMFESKAFYQAYCHILKRLKNINTEALPFHDILINFNVENYKKARIEFIPEYCRTQIMKYNNTDFYPVKNIWPQQLERTLDKSQFEAIKYALLNKVALIQGPPGTGKTYVGTLVCKILMESTKNPILIVCYTNHALDQFLSHIYKHEKNILRIGGRSKSAELLDLSLAAKRNEAFKAFALKTNRDIYNVKRTILKVSEEVEKILSVSNKKKGIKYEEFESYFPLLVEKIFGDFEKIIPKKIRYDNKNRKINVEKTLETFRHEILYAWMNLGDLDKIFETIAFNLFLDEEDEAAFYEFYKLIECDLDQNNNLIKNIYNNSNNDFSNFYSTNTKNENFGKSTATGENKIEFIEADLEEDEEENMDRMYFNEGYDSAENERNLMRNIKASGEDADLAYKEHFYECEENFKQKEFDEFYFRSRLLSAGNIWLIGKSLRYRMVLVIKEKIWEAIGSKYAEKFEELRDLIKIKNELENEQDLQIIKTHKIVGMTTTGCAKYSAYLENIQFETVIVEEAAEVVESHMVALLTQNTKHLIMIGDHLQLRPKIYNFEIEKKFKFEVSLFERLINNSYPVSFLSHQRRMRPEFADFVRLIYGNNYNDHDVTFNREHIKGFYVENQISKNMIFFNHNYVESSNSGLASKENFFEAEFICYWARFLTQQNIPEEKITILTFYVGQILKIREQLKALKLNEIRVSSVDNYQGEENDFILLSLVRSNKEGKIGFLKVRNRVCVAFSRAKIGFFVIGNFDFLKNAAQAEKKEIEKEKVKNSSAKNNINNNISLWEEIHELAKTKKILVNELNISCQKHKNITVITTAKDFNNIPEGGCKELCKERMECGHVCEIYCHNFSHESVKCTKPCERIIPECKHKCQKKCFQDCKNCQVLIKRKLACGHSMLAECSKNTKQTACTQICGKALPCGHKCKGVCLDACSLFICEAPTHKRLLCGHTAVIPCNMSPELYECQEKCDAILPGCSHKCQGTCGLCMQGSLHIKCESKCDKNLVCGHICKKGCGDNCLCVETCENYCSHGQCGLKCMVECINCIEQCQNGCEHQDCKLLCCQECEIKPCNKRCEQVLACGHRCYGLCGEKCPNACKICEPDNEAFQIYFGNEDDADALFYELDCGHIIELQALDKWLDAKEKFSRPQCPKCKTGIVRSNRYFNEIKYFYEQLNKIKKIYLKELNKDYQSINYLKDIEKLIREIDKEFRIESGHYMHFNTFIKSVKSLGKKDYDLLITAKNMLALFEKLLKIEEIFQKVNENVKTSLLFKFFNNHYLSLIKRFDKVSFMKKEDFEKLSLKVDSVYYAILILEKYEVYKNSRFCDYLLKGNLMIKDANDLNDFVSNFGSLETRKIIEIINIMSGVRWYQCPNRHVYAIGDCGMPMQEALCPECGSRIGGSNHNLNANNTQFNISNRNDHNAN